MSFEKTPAGTRGARTPPTSNPVARLMARVMSRYHRLRGDRFLGMDLLYLTTIGAESGARRQTPVARFPDGQGGWLIVASSAGSARHPGWYHNIAAHPDQVWAEVDGQHRRMLVEQLGGGGTRRRVAAHHRGPTALRLVRSQNRSRHSGHPPDPCPAGVGRPSSIRVHRLPGVVDKRRMPG